MTAILGISAFYHDAAAAIVVDGQIVAAAQEERFSRKKHDADFPRQAVEYCLSQARLAIDDIEYLGFYEKPLSKFDRLLETYLAYAPRGYASFRRAIPQWVSQKLHLSREMRRGMHRGFRGRIVYAEHHESHAASAFFPSPFEEAAILTMDGVGEWSTTCIGVGQGNRIELTHEMRFPHSLGLLYSAFTQYTGFRVNSGEYKLMGLAPYGEPIYRELILDRLIDLKDDGSFRMDMRYFNYCHGLTMTSRAFHKLFGGPPRAMESPIRQRDMDLAASIQAVAEEIILRMARHAHAQTGQRKLVMAGGVALNCVANGRILREGPFEDIWIQPAAGDAGGALGIALFIWHQLLGRPRQVTGEDSQRASLLGPSYSDEAIADLLRMKGEAFTAFTTEDELCRHVAESLAQGKVVGWFQGRMEFGPRALGSRSILGDPRSASMRSVMNQKIKFRESFRPFAPIVTRESASEYFELSPSHDSPYMLIVAPVRENQRLELDDAARSARGFDKLKHPRSRLPAITHVDDSARVQTVDRTRNPLLHRLLLAFRERTGCAVLINTSFNVRGEPIVCTPDDALRCFHATDIEVLVLGRSVLKKEVRFESGSGEARRRHLAAFPLD